MGTPSPNPWDLSLPANRALKPGGVFATRFCQPLVGALVASRRCRILRSGSASLPQFSGNEKLPQNIPAAPLLTRYKYPLKRSLLSLCLHCDS